MKTISLVVCDRPHYTREVLESLRTLRRTDYKLFIRAEPVCMETQEICAAVDFMDVHFEVNQQVLGIHWNNKSLYDQVFGAGSTFNVAVEDDTPLAPDAIDLAEWFRNLPSRDEYLLLNFFNHSRSLDEPLGLFKHNAFCPWGYCMTKEAYSGCIEPAWMCDERGWDWSICSMMARQQRKSLAPHVSRSRNIGRLGGVYCAPQNYDKVFGGHVMSMGGYGTDFSIDSPLDSHIPGLGNCD
jgi:hypothetical protein